jgi:hypothetical protein
MFPVLLSDELPPIPRLAARPAAFDKAPMPGAYLYGAPPERPMS